MKDFGYFISTISVMLLGIVAWKHDQPSWKAILLICGVAASIFGLFLRFLAHRKEQAGIEYATREAEQDSQGQ